MSGAVSSSAALVNLHAEVASQLNRGGLKSTLEAAGVIRIPLGAWVVLWSPLTSVSEDLCAPER